MAITDFPQQFMVFDWQQKKPLRKMQAISLNMKAAISMRAMRQHMLKAIRKKNTRNTTRHL